MYKSYFKEGVYDYHRETRKQLQKYFSKFKDRTLAVANFSGEYNKKPVKAKPGLYKLKEITKSYITLVSKDGKNEISLPIHFSHSTGMAHTEIEFTSTKKKDTGIVLEIVYKYFRKTVLTGTIAILDKDHKLAY